MSSTLPTIQVAYQLQTGANGYHQISTNDLFKKLKSDTITCFEIIKDCNVKPYYDFDWLYKKNDKVSKDQLVEFIHTFVENKYNDLGFADADPKMMSRFVTQDANGDTTKLSLHIIMNNCGVYPQALDFYHFKNDKQLFIDAIENDFGVDVNDVFVVGKDLFDQTVYKSRESQQKFGMVLSSKQANGDQFIPIDKHNKPIDLTLETFPEYIVTSHVDNVDKPCCQIQSKPPVEVKKTTEKKVEATPSPKAQKKIETPKSTTLPAPTLEDIKSMMSEIKAKDVIYVESRDWWFKLISAGLGSVRTHKLDEDAYVDFACDWSACEKYNDMKLIAKDVYKLVNNAKETTSQFGELVKMYKDITGKNVNIRSSSLYDINPKDVVLTYYDSIMMQKFTYAQDVVLYMCGCIFSFATDDLSVRLRTKTGMMTQKINSILSKNGSSGSTKILLSSSSDKYTTYAELLLGLLKSDYYRKNNHFTSTGFIPFSPLNPIKTDKLNLFNGFAYELETPIPENECILYNYFHENFSSTQESEYALDWVAACLQNPKVRPPVMILFSEEQGTGKSTLQNIIGRLFQGYTLSVSSIEKNLLGNFNSQMANKLIINCSEVQSTDGGQRVSVSQNETLKTLITETKLLINEKNVNQYEVDFYGKFVISCNYADAIRITKEDRRFSILNFGAKNKGNTKYFNKIANAIDNDDCIKQLFNILLHRDISNFSPTKPITNTETTRHAYKTSLPIAYTFLYNLVSLEDCTKSVVNYDKKNKLDFAAGSFRISSSDLHLAYSSFCRSSNISHVQSATMFNKTIAKLQNSNGVDVIETVKASCMFKVFTREGIVNAIKVAMGGCDDSDLESLLM